MTVYAPRVLFAAPSSGAGKTTVTCAILRAFHRRGLHLAAFKCGPDYIDPMFQEDLPDHALPQQEKIQIGGRNAEHFPMKHTLSEPPYRSAIP